MLNIWSIEHILSSKRLIFQSEKANAPIKWPRKQNLRPKYLTRKLGGQKGAKVPLVVILPWCVKKTLCCSKSLWVNLLTGLCLSWRLTYPRGLPVPLLSACSLSKMNVMFSLRESASRAPKTNKYRDQPFSSITSEDLFRARIKKHQ